MFCSVVLCTSNVSEALDSTYYLQLKIKSRKLCTFPLLNILSNSLKELCTFPLLNILSNSLKDISLSFSLFFKNQIIFPKCQKHQKFGYWTKTRENIHRLIT